MEAESQEDVNGEWVKYEDYARLHSLFANSEQENARLKADLEKSDGVVFTQAVENERLKAEVDRLRKAGDTLADFFVPDIDDLGHNYGFNKSVESVISNWNAAKEGKPSV